MRENDTWAPVNLQKGQKINYNANVVAKEETLRSTIDSSFPLTKPREPSLKQGGEEKGRKQAQNDRTEGEEAYRSGRQGEWSEARLSGSTCSVVIMQC